MCPAEIQLISAHKIREDSQALLYSKWLALSKEVLRSVSFLVFSRNSIDDMI
ncbi:hypothetical protein S1OALGB6SA_1353 [Olavius algarvensis spirochete endosymbiont]|nr:hypothetical protein S1OALGB6SA_1353 [Olavius algarvensis spirochete endosymbiont]